MAEIISRNITGYSRLRQASNVVHLAMVARVLACSRQTFRRNVLTAIIAFFSLLDMGVSHRAARAAAPGEHRMPFAVAGPASAA